MSCIWEVETGVGSVNADAEPTDFVPHAYPDPSPVFDEPGGTLFDLSWASLPIHEDDDPSHALLINPTVIQQVNVLSMSIPTTQEFIQNGTGIPVTDDGYVDVATRWQARWRIRIPDPLAGHTLTPFTYEYEHRDFMRWLGSAYHYCKTSAQDAAGWVPVNIPFEEKAWIGGGLGSEYADPNDEQYDAISWRVSLEDGDATLELWDGTRTTLMASATPFAVDPDVWYWVEMYANGTDIGLRMFDSAGAVPVDYEIVEAWEPPAPLPAFLTFRGDLLLYLPDPWHADVDQIEVWGQTFTQGSNPDQGTSLEADLRTIHVSRKFIYGSAQVYVDGRYYGPHRYTQYPNEGRIVFNEAFADADHVIRVIFYDGGPL